MGAWEILLPTLVSGEPSSMGKEGKLNVSQFTYSISYSSNAGLTYCLIVLRVLESELDKIV